MKTAYEVISLSMLELGIEPTYIRMMVHRGSILSQDMEISVKRYGVCISISFQSKVCCVE